MQNVDFYIRCCKSTPLFVYATVSPSVTETSSPPVSRSGGRVCSILAAAPTCPVCASAASVPPVYYFSGTGSPSEGTCVS